MVRFLHTGDWHLGARLAQRSRAAEQQAFLLALAERVSAGQIDLVLVAGDVYDRPFPEPAAQALLFDGLAGLREAGAAVILLAGDFDGPEALSALRRLVEPLGVSVVARKAERIERCGLSIAALPPFALEGHETIDAAYTRYFGGEAPDLLITHAPSFGGYAPRALAGDVPLSEAALGPSVRYAAIGHEHQYAAEGRRVTAGSPIALAFAESGPRYWVEGELADAGPARFRAVPRANARTLVRLSGEPEAIEAAIGALEPAPLPAWISVTASDDLSREEVAGWAARRGAELVEFTERTSVFGPVPGLRELDPEAVFRLLHKRRNERLDPAVLALFRAIAAEVP